MMSKALTGITVAVAILAGGSVARAQVEIKNDSFVSNGAAVFNSGFADGDHGAVRLIPIGTAPFQVTKVRLLFGPASVQRDITLHIFDDSAGNVNPGTELFTADFTLMGSNNAFSEIDLAASNVVVSGPFRVSIEFSQLGDPQIARDNDGTPAGRNFIFDQPNFGGWFDSSILVAGDWIIRADIVDANGPGPTPDAGPGPGEPDAGPGGPDAGTGQVCALNSDCPNGQYCGDQSACTFDCRLDVDCSSGSECNAIGQCVDSSGGGCAAGGAASGSGALLVMVLIVGLGRRRRD